MQANTINEKFGIDKYLTFSLEHHTIMAKISTAYSTAKISLYGAQVLSFVPKGERDLLFVSSKAQYTNGKAIRGGIPVCWPWFNAHPVNASFPSHGFARISTWEVLSTTVEKEEVILSMGLKPNEDTQMFFPYFFEATVTIRVGRQLKVELTTKNTGKETFNISSALHSYFSISDIETVKLKGLYQTAFKDDVKDREGTQDTEYLTFSERTDRRYRATAANLSIIDKDRIINIWKEGSRVTVVWNPWAELAQQMADLGDNDYRRMLCVESANTLEDTIAIGSGQSHTLGTTIGL